MDRFGISRFSLFPWQREAVAQWVRGDGAPYRGTLQIFTGGGKTMIALACAEEAARVSDDFRLIVIVPTIALADQWVAAIRQYTNLDPRRVKRISGALPRDHAIEKVLVVVINTAAKLRNRLVASEDTMLIVDECHRAGAPTFRAVLDIKARFRLGLSATPEREEINENGEPLAFDEQIVAKRLGGVVYSFDLANAREAGWLPHYKIIHHGLSLHPNEQAEYDRQSRRIDDLTDSLRQLGGDPSRARSLQGKKGDLGDAARAYLAATALRKDLLYRAQERLRITQRIVAGAVADPSARLLLFNERISAAEELYKELVHRLPSVPIALEHSKLTDAERRAALDGFRDGSVQVLISAKSLIEGIDVPSANVGISVASTGSVRQRVQALGRVLRRSVDSETGPKIAQMHVLYVADTVDETIYEKEDWSDLTGESRNEYLRWPLDPAAEPSALEGPPRRPKPTEEQEYERLAAGGFAFPALWNGVVRGQEYRIDTRDNISNAFGTAISDPQRVGEMLFAARGVRGGKFIVTPRYRFVLTAVNIKGETVWYAAGQLREAFVPRAIEAEAFGGQEQHPEAFRGPLNAANGTFKIRARRGGSIERRVSREVSQFARTDGDPADPRVTNARRVLEAWNAMGGKGLDFYVNDCWDAWYQDSGVPHFLAHVPNGFGWPEEG